MKKEIIGFIGQEGAHGHAHDKANQIMRNMGYDIDPILQDGTDAIQALEGWLTQSEYGRKVALSMTMSNGRLRCLASRACGWHRRNLA